MALRHRMLKATATYPPGGQFHRSPLGRAINHTGWKLGILRKRIG